MPTPIRAGAPPRPAKHVLLVALVTGALGAALLVIGLDAAGEGRTATIHKQS
ncbi:hypothetical protein [Cupriavidus basilensis]|uniref:Uncharacterized protein n=1 Tax=Cupriavidus basilensis TaxID=68895 RepID=A0A7M2GPQ8_9BURK|nr:hypothetical protein [Cupriavidus basilensis]QOT74754.1 hypothetical protein F7R26_010780 [Cupriavidus basilensis]